VHKFKPDSGTLKFHPHTQQGQHTGQGAHTGGEQRARGIIARQGFSGLYRALKAGAPLPAAALVPLASVLQEQTEVE
jgi:hypothetical protein